MVRIPLSHAERAQGRALGACIRRFRGERSPLEIATAASVSPETLRKIETGRILVPSFATVAKLASALDISLDELWRAVAVETDRATEPEGIPDAAIA
ncbi:helix-turn-helix domain-containing protein [Humidisolicoccus flavus]|uniref:helix-turn-helix domain-containing protein n=1 Tax=Humidisolicoccus flavus TaxID=3111414 RepID=UPI00324D99CF